MTPTRFAAVILDMDGVVTKTARVHARAWKETFDAVLADLPADHPGDASPFDIETDYRRYVDGKPRLDGVRSFLGARGIPLPDGSPDDPPDTATVHGIGARKNNRFHELLAVGGVETYPDTIDRIEHWRQIGIRTALITSSRNAERILDATGLRHLFDVVVDGAESERLGLRGKPAPDIFLEAARRLDVEPAEAVVVEDAISGVEAGRAGGFGLVVGVARNSDEALRKRGAEIVVRDLRSLGELARDPTLPTGHATGPGDGEADGMPAGGGEPGVSGRAQRIDRIAREWDLVYTRWDPEEQPLREALCALGNGWIVTRGAFEECDASWPHYPGTYIAGGYNRLESEVAGRVVENEDLVNWPNWLPLTFRIDGGDWFHPDAVDIVAFEYRLDLRSGVLHRRVEFRDDAGRAFTLETRRFVSMAEPNLAAIEWTLTPRDWSGELEIRSGLDGAVRNQNVARYQALANRHLEVLETGLDGEDAVVLAARTNQSLVRMSQAARTRVFEGDSPVPVRRETDIGNDAVAHRLFVPCCALKPLRVEKIVSIRTSRDFGISEASLAARKDVRRAGTFAESLEEHARRWEQLWAAADIDLRNGDIETQLILRLHIFHILQTASPNTIDRDVGVPARGWHGEAYRGHIFWDELFIFPFLTLRVPELARSLLMYRHERLDEARHAARVAGYEGAMFPWQSGSDGREETQVLHLNPRSGRWLPDTTHRQRHVNAAIAYTVWEYYEATADLEFLTAHGAEMILEIARFWASIAEYDPARQRYVIRGVMGPDEFHTADARTGELGLSNNAYTNVMAAWVLRLACHLLGELDDAARHDLAATLQLKDEEPLRWDEISRGIYVPFLDDGIISQFEGYETLAEFDWDRYREKYGDIHRLDRILEAEGDDVNRYKASKQADVLMLFYLFSSEELTELFQHMDYRFEPEWIPRTIDYYLRRSSHGSTLSYVVHSWVLARSDREAGWQFFRQALRADIEDIQGGTTPEGIHLGALAGTVDLIQRGFTGLVMRDDVLWFDPVLPRELSDMVFRLRYRGHWLSVEVRGGRLRICCDRAWAPPVRIGFRGTVHTLGLGDTWEFALD